MTIKKFILGIIILVVIAVVIFISKGKTADAPAHTTETISTSTPTIKISSLSPKISFVQSDARTAIFKINVQLDFVTMENIRVFTQSASVANSGVQDNFEDDDFSVTYDSKKMTITLKDTASDVRKERVEYGAFRTLCAACTHEVEFTNLKTTEGVVIQKTQVSIY